MCGVRLTWAGTAFLMAALGVFAAIYYFAGDACRSSARIDALYAVPFLLGLACFLYVTRTAPRWWRGIAAGVATASVSAGLLLVLAIIHYGVGGCYT
jgi:hypothetical protein